MPPIVMKVLLFHQWLTLKMLYSIISNFLITGDATVIPIIVTILPSKPPRDCQTPNTLREYDNEKKNLYSYA